MRCFRRTAVGFVAAFAFPTLALPATAAPSSPAGVWDENAVSISGESLPVGIRLTTFVVHTVYFMREHLVPGGKGMAHVRRFLEGTGLEKVDDATLTSLSRFYGDFKERQEQRWRQAFEGKERLPAGVMDSLVMDRAEFVGGIFGRWLREIESKGHDPEALVRAIERRSSSRIMGRENVPSDEALEEESRLFEVGFERELGRPLQAMLCARGEVGK